MHRTRRHPTYFFKSSSASVEGRVRFGEGCVVLPHARICVPPGFTLEVGPFTLFADFSELYVTTSTALPLTSSSPAAGACTSPLGANPKNRLSPDPVTTLRISSHNHFQSYTRVCFNLHTVDRDAAVKRAAENPAQGPLPEVNKPEYFADTFPIRVELLGSGNVFQPFASVHVHMYTDKPSTSPSLPSSSAASSVNTNNQQKKRFPSRSWQLGNFNIFTTHTHVHLISPSDEQSLLAKEEAMRTRGSLFPPASAMPALEKETEEGAGGSGGGVQRKAKENVHNPAPTAPFQIAGPFPPGRVSVEERLFQDHSSDDEINRNDETTEVSSSPSPFLPRSSRTVTPSFATNHEEGSLPLSLSNAHVSNSVVAAATTRIDNMIYFSLNAPPSTYAEAVDITHSVALPRYGTRSVSELPTIIKRIIEEEKKKKEHEQQQQLLTTTPAAMQEPASPIAAAAGALANLESYVDSVHPDLRAHTEESVLAEVERVCRYYIRQYIEDADLYPVDAQFDDD